MYAAYNSDKQLIYAKTIGKDIKGPFYCPLCESEVFYRKSSLGRGYFAHKNTCLKTDQSVGNKGESAHHQAGKEALYHELSAALPTVSCEYLIEATHQYADISLLANNKRYVIEFQYSPIPASQIIQRTQDYSKEVDACIWLIDVSALSHRQQSVWLSANLNWHPQLGYFLLALDVPNRRLVFELDISLIETNVTSNTISYQSIITLIDFNPTNIRKVGQQVKLGKHQRNYHYDRRIRSIQTSVVYRKLLMEWYQYDFNIRMIPPKFLVHPMQSIVLKQPLWILVGWLMVSLKVTQEKPTVNYLTPLIEDLIQREKVTFNPTPFIVNKHQLIQQLASELVDLLNN